MNLAGKHVFVTGSAGGIGRALCAEFARAGAHVHLVARRQNLQQEEDLRSLGAASVRSWHLDLGQSENIERVVKSWGEQGIPVDVLVNNAGLLTGGLLEEQPVADILAMLQVNIVSLIHLTRLVLPQMVARKAGKIVNNASVSGVMFLPCASTYAASKAAVVGFTKSLQEELRGTGVTTLLMITPGVKTDMFQEIYDLYGKNMDLSWLSSISAEEWAKRVREAIETDQEVLLPSGASRIGVSLAQHLPGLFNSLVRSRFNRTIR